MGWSRRRSAAAIATAVPAVLLAAAAALLPTPAGGTPATFLGSLGAPTQVASTVPPDGDVNPYGVAVVPASVGRLVAGSTLVSNFNGPSNLQGTGTTIVQISSGGVRTTFAHVTPASLPAGMRCPGGIGLTTALAVLSGGWVVVGSLPDAPGGALPSENPAGCLVVLNSAGTPVETWTGAFLNGPWDLTAVPTATGADLFVADVLTRPAGAWGTPTTGECDIERLSVSLSGPMPALTGWTAVGNHFFWRANPAAFVQGPTGVALAPSGTLYVAETPQNHITAIPDALTRTTAVSDGTSTLTSGGALHGPLGLTVAPNGDVVTVNGNNGIAVEVDPAGQQVATKLLVENGAGDLFGLTTTPDQSGLLFVNDGTNALDLAGPRR